ncbi:MAG: leucine-rich repeat domain-containing protein [Cryomorphaceae bacterium]|nr:MAG: leucine-rich repeat domain-containing protein [Cryomorphaceae bacterium]
MKNFLTIAFLLLMATGSRAQFIEDLQQDYDYEFRSLQEALRDPDAVYYLRLNVKKGEIPPEVFTLTNLRSLTLKKGKITQIPAEISALVHLEKLDLTQNKLERFPEEVIGLPQLRILKLGKNPISRLPDEMVNMQKLEVLDLWSTRVSRFPVAIEKMSSLREVDLRMVEVDRDEQSWLKEALPNVNFHFSAPCDCR